MMSRSLLRRSQVVLALLWFAAVPAAAQELGTRIRITTVDGRRTSGTVTHVGEDRVEVAESATRKSVFARDRVARIELSHRKERKFGRNFAITVGATAAVVGVGWALIWTPCTDTGFMACFMTPTSRTEALQKGAVAGGVLGIPIGIITGVVLKSDVWQPISSSSLPQFSLVPTSDGGAYLRLRLQF